MNQEETTYFNQLENLFFAAIDALNSTWEGRDANSLLLTILYHKCILYSESFTHTPEELNWFESFKIATLERPDTAVSELMRYFTTYSTTHQDFDHIYTPAIKSLSKHQSEAEHLLASLLILEQANQELKAINKEQYGTFFNGCLHKIARYAETKARKNAIPLQLNKLLAALAKPQTTEAIFMPDAGYGDGLIALNNRSPFNALYVIEHKAYSLAVCRMNLILNKIPTKNTHLGEALLEHDKIPPVDLIVFNRPFGFHADSKKSLNQKYLQLPYDVNALSINSHQLHIQLIINKLKPNGRAICLLPLQLLREEHEHYKLRQWLVNRDYIETIISLPHNLLYASGMPLCIIILRKQKKEAQKRKIHFTDGKNIPTTQQSRLYRELTDQQIADLCTILDNSNNHKNSQILSATTNQQTIVSNNYQLEPRWYTSAFTKKRNSLLKAGILANLESILRGAGPALWFDESIQEPFYYVTSKNLTNSISNYLIDTELLSLSNNLKQFNGRFVNEDSLILQKKGQKVLWAWFNYSGTPILVDENLMVFQPNLDKIDIEYLFIQFENSFVSQQLQSLQYDKTYQQELEYQFKQIQIALPSLEEQQAQVKEYKILLLKKEEYKVEELRRNLNIDRQKAQINQNRILSSLQHELGNRLPAVLTEFKNLKDYLFEKEENAETIDFSDPIFPIFEGEELEDVDRVGLVLQRIESTLRLSINSINATSNIIEAGRSSLHLNNVKIRTLLEEIKAIYSGRKNIDIQIAVEEDSFGKEIDIEAQIDKSQMITAFTNLIDNAIRHGFTPNKKHIIHLQVGLSQAHQEVIIIYKNNGKPFPDNFTFDDFISYGNYAGKTGHSGIGGFLIAQIIENHNGTLSLRKNISPRDYFKVQFEISIPVEH